MTPQETGGLSYDQDLLLNWDIKCTRAPEEEAIFLGVFEYRHGIPLDYESIHGMAYYHNHIPRDDLQRITGYLQGRYGGKEKRKGDRVFLVGAREFFDPAEIADLATSMESRFDTKSVITLEFQGMTQDEMRAAGLPDSKLLPVPGK